MKRKRWIFCAALGAMALLAACSEKEEITVTTVQEPENTTASIISTEENDVEQQIALIAGKQQLWKAPLDDMPYSYTVADMNQNGRLEIITAACQGTGYYTTASVFEVNEAGDDLTEYERALEEYMPQADLIVGTVPVYYDEQQKVYQWIFDDLTKNGVLEYYENKRAWSLQENKIIERFLAYKTTLYTDADTEPAVSCTDAVYGGGKEITEEEYQQMADTVFSGMEKKTGTLHWITKENTEWDNMSEEELHQILSDAWSGFTID